MKKLYSISAILIVMLFASTAVADEPSDSAAAETERKSGIAPDLREDDTKLKLQKGDFVVVPIPMSNPTLDTGLIVGAAYFYPQTEEQKNVQPASVTGAAAMYTNNESLAYGIAHQSYFKENKWRIGGVLGGADLKLTLRSPTGDSDEGSSDWLVDGVFFFGQALGNFAGRWYAGPVARLVDVTQTFLPASMPDADPTIVETKAVGLGINFEYDHRDMPMNPYSGNRFQLKTLFNDESLGSDSTYQSYDISYSSYHETKHPLVLAWVVSGCERGGDVPLWDMCRIPLRGFAATDYLGLKSVAGQFEARWRMSKRWGLVGFAGAGYIVNTYVETDHRDVIPSYGVGLRFMVLAAKRINLRLDFAKSTDSDAVYFSVGEAF